MPQTVLTFTFKLSVTIISFLSIPFPPLPVASLHFFSPIIFCSSFPSLTFSFPYFPFSFFQFPSFSYLSFPIFSYPLYLSFPPLRTPYLLLPSSAFNVFLCCGKETGNERKGESESGLSTSNITGSLIVFPSALLLLLLFHFLFGSLLLLPSPGWWGSREVMGEEDEYKLDEDAVGWGMVVMVEGVNEKEELRMKYEVFQYEVNEMKR